MIRIFHKDKEYDSVEELEKAFPNVYMQNTSKIKDIKGNVIGREYLYVDYTEDQLTEIENSRMRVKIAKGRAECFDIINRGKLWYDSLTAIQLTELNVWYQEWLDIPDKPLDYIPVKPSWIN